MDFDFKETKSSLKDIDKEDSSSDTDTDTDTDNDEYLLPEYEENTENNSKNVTSNKTVHYIKDDFESVITLSNAGEIIHNKKIQQIKQTIDTLLSDSFTLEECIKIHSIYNFNSNCLQRRNKFLQEYVLILVFLENIGICFFKNLLSLVFPKMLIQHKRKKFDKIKEEILSSFVFSDFKSNINLDPNQNPNYLIEIIEKHTFGLLFYIKNRVLLYRNQDGFTKKEQNELINLLLKNRNATFNLDHKMKQINTWLSNLVKNLIIYNIYNIYDTTNKKSIFNKKKTIEYHVSFGLRVVMSFIIGIASNEVDSRYIKIFLLYNDEEKIAEKLITNTMLHHIFKEILNNCKKEETIKIFKKEFVNHLKNVLGNNGYKNMF